LAVCAAAIFALFAAGSCRDPTEIELQLSSDFDCATLGASGLSAGTTSISVARDLASITVPTTSIPSCASTKPNELGSLVLVPSGDGDDVAILIVAGLGKEACANDAPTFAGCVVAKRRIRFVKHEHLVLPILLRTVCAGRPCTGDLTCVDGQCVSSFVDPGSCPNGLCPTGGDGSVPADATSPIDGPAPDDARTDAALDAPADALVDAPFDGSNKCVSVGAHRPTPGEVDCPPNAPLAKCVPGTEHCCTSTCQPVANLCGTQPTSQCDETADCPPGNVCCVIGLGASLFTTCATSCNLTQRRLCKTTCECADCIDAPACSIATCGGTCP